MISIVECGSGPRLVLDPLPEDAAPTPEPPHGVPGGPHGVHAPRHHRRAPGEAVVDEDDVLLGLVVEAEGPDLLQDQLRLVPADAGAAGDPYRRIPGDEAGIDGHLHQPPGGDGGGDVDGGKQGLQPLFLVDLPSDLGEAVELASVLPDVAAYEEDSDLLGGGGVDGDGAVPGPPDGDPLYPDMLVDRPRIIPGRLIDLHLLSAEEVEGRPRLGVDEPRSLDQGVGYGSRQAAEVADGARIGHLRRCDPPVEGRPEVEGEARISEVDVGPLRPLLYPGGGELPLHLVGDDLDPRRTLRREDRGYGPVEDDPVHQAVGPEPIGDVLDRHRRGHQPRRDPGYKAAVGEGLDEGPHLVRRREAGNDPRRPDDEVQVVFDGEPRPGVALQEGVTHQIRYRLPGEGGAAEGMGEDLLPRLRLSHVPGHLHRLVDDPGLTVLHVGGGEDAFGGAVSHLHRGDDVVGVLLQLQDVHRGALGDPGLGLRSEETGDAHISRDELSDHKLFGSLPP